MAMAETVRSPVEAAVGRVLMHEHVFVLGTEIQQNYPESWDEEARVGDAVRQLRRSSSAASTPWPTRPCWAWAATCSGSSGSTSRRASTSSRRPASTPTTTCRCSSACRDRVSGFGIPEPMTEMFVRDLEEDTADTGVRAAFLTCAIDAQGMTPGVERVMRAVAQAHVRTGAPITMHTHVDNKPGLLAREALAAGCRSDEAGHRLRGGQRRPRLPAPARRPGQPTRDGPVRAGRPAAVRAAGGHRGAAVSAGLRRADGALPGCLMLPRLAPGTGTRAGRARWHYNHVTDDVLPALREHGVTGEQITTMLVDNPRRYFEVEA